MVTVLTDPRQTAAESLTAAVVTAGPEVYGDLFMSILMRTRTLLATGWWNTDTEWFRTITTQAMTENPKDERNRTAVLTALTRWEQSQ